MDYLVIKYKYSDDMFVQKRIDREQSNGLLIDFKIPIETIVLKSCKTKEEADNYIQSINQVNKLLENL